MLVGESGGWGVFYMEKKWEMGNGKGVGWEGGVGCMIFFLKEGKGSRSFSRCYTLRGVEGEQIELAVHERY